ncbi:RUN and FYVE domain-containing protein 4 [Anolis carolinensis]|uniref:RUN and FYVE domain-containing protein 4 n=1 Tax=Anolis carolinensis TaxID=28377 RepID=UPI002F2B68AD
MASTRELLRVIKDLENIVIELNANYQARGLPVTDGSRELQQFCAQLEFLLQYDLKEKRNLFGQKKDYWDFLSRVLTRLHSGIHEGLQHVTSLDKLKTSLGKGRAFLRYCLVHRQLAETLQLCFMEPDATSEWYYARSPFLDKKLWLDILGSLYELEGITFHLALCRADLDAAWPMVSEALPQRSIPVAKHTNAENESSEVRNSNHSPGSNQEATQAHKNALRTKDLYVPQSTNDDPVRLGWEHSIEKWVGVWRNRKNSLLQMGSLVKLSSFMEKEAQHPVSVEEVKRGNGESQIHVDKFSKEQPGKVSSSQDLSSLLSQPEHFLCEKMEDPQVTSENEDCWKQKDLRAMIWELSALQLKMAQQQEENKYLKQALLEENQALKEELAKHEKQQKEKMNEQEKQQQELSKVVKSLREAESKIANLTIECQEAWAKKDAAERRFEEAEQRLSSQEAEWRRCLAEKETQELKHQQMISQCQGLQEKLKVCEKSLDRWETQVAALSSHHGQLETSEAQSEGTNDTLVETALEKGLLREKLERRLAEIKMLEREKETLTETLISQENSFMLTKLEAQDLQMKVSVCQEHIFTLQMSLQKTEKVLKDKEEQLQGLQNDLQAQTNQLQVVLKENTTLKVQLEEMAQKKSQLIDQLAEERTQCERIRQESVSQIGTIEKEVAKLQEEKKQLQATLQQGLEEREALAKHLESTTAALKGQIQEITQLRSELENGKATSQALQKTLQDKNEIVASALREECLQLKTRVGQLEQEKNQATDIAKKLSEELEQYWEWSTEKSIPLCGNVLTLEPETRDEKARVPVKERGILTEANSSGVATPQLMDILPVGMPQALENAVKKVSCDKHENQTHGKCLNSHLDKIMNDVQHAKQKLAAKADTTKHLMEQLSRSQQEKEQLQVLLEKRHQESKEKENKYKQQLSEQGELICSMKGKLLELLREKDALWQKTEGISPPVACSAPQTSGTCTLCKKDFRLMSRRYQCRLCQHTVCHACSVSTGQKERCCLPCHQKRNSQGT